MGDLAKRHGQISVSEYADEWRNRANVFALDPANLPLQQQQKCRSSGKSAFPSALHDIAPDRLGQQLIRRAFRKAGQQRALSEIDYLLAINDQTRMGTLGYPAAGSGLVPQERDRDVALE